MNTSPQTTARTPRLNPFAFPSDTDFRFVLLIVAVLGASLFIYRAVYFSIPSTRDYWLTIINDCWKIRPELPTDLTQYADPELVAARIAFEECKAPAERANAAWTLGGVFLLLSVAGFIYWTFPLRKIRRDQLVPLSRDAPEVVDYISKLSRGAKLSSHPTFLWNPLNPTSGGLAFGRRGKYYVSLTGGLVTQFYKDPPAFRAVVLHELAHLRNADVAKTYFAVAVWQAFVIAALLPFLVTLVGNEWGYVANQLWRVLALAALVYLMRNAVLRTRELYADVRASAWDGPAGALSRVLDSMPRPKTSSRPIAFQMHPDLATRRQVLEDPDRLFPMRFWDAFATGVAAAVALPDLISLMTALRTGASSPGMESLGGVLVVAPLVVGVVGLGAWRTTFATLARGEAPRNTGYLGAGLGVGILLGVIFSFNSAVRLAATEALSGSELLFHIAWGALLVISLFFFLWWIAAGASAWLEVAVANDSPRPFYLLGLTIAGGVLAIWLGLLFYIHGLGSAVIYVLVSPLGTLWSIVQHPFTLLLMVSLWAFPLAAWFGRRRVASASGSGWAFLTSSPEEPVLVRQAPFRLGFALTVGLIVGFVFCGLLLLTRIALRINLPEAVRNTDDFRLAFFLIQIAVAAFMQAGTAALVAAWIQRLGAIHGLFSAFVAGCVMTVGLLVINVAFGGTLDPQFVWFTFSQVVNEGGMLAIPVAWIVSGFADLVRHLRNRPSLLPQNQIT